MLSVYNVVDNVLFFDSYIDDGEYISSYAIDLNLLINKSVDELKELMNKIVVYSDLYYDSYKTAEYRMFHKDYPPPYAVIQVPINNLTFDFISDIVEKKFHKLINLDSVNAEIVRTKLDDSAVLYLNSIPDYEDSDITDEDYEDGTFYIQVIDFKDLDDYDFVIKRVDQLYQLSLVL